MNPPALPLALTQAQACWQRGDLIQAETLCRQALLQDRNNGNAYALLAAVLTQSKQTPKAETLGRQWAGLCPGDGRAHAFCGDVLREQGQIEAAIRSCSMLCIFRVRRVTCITEWAVR